MAVQRQIGLISQESPWVELPKSGDQDRYKTSGRQTLLLCQYLSASPQLPDFSNCFSRPEANTEIMASQDLDVQRDIEANIPGEDELSMEEKKNAVAVTVRGDSSSSTPSTPSSVSVREDKEESEPEAPLEMPPKRGNTLTRYIFRQFSLPLSRPDTTSITPCRKPPLTPCRHLLFRLPPHIRRNFHLQSHRLHRLHSQEQRLTLPPQRKKCYLGKYYGMHSLPPRERRQPCL